jgi:hypothetical protein
VVWVSIQARDPTLQRCYQPLIHSESNDDLQKSTPILQALTDNTVAYNINRERPNVLALFLWGLLRNLCPNFEANTNTKAKMTKILSRVPNGRKKGRNSQLTRMSQSRLPNPDVPRNTHPAHVTGIGKFGKKKERKFLFKTYLLSKFP